MAPPVLQMAFSAAGRAARPLQPVASGLRRNDRSLNAGQKLLRFGQGQSQVSNIAKTFRPADLYQIGAQAAGITLRRNQPQHPSHPRSPGRLSTRPTVPPVSSCPHSLDTPCSISTSMFDQVMPLSTVEQLATYAQSKPIQQALAVEECPAAPTPRGEGQTASR